MKSIISIAVIGLVLIAVSGNVLAQSCKRLGVRDCRHTIDPTTNKPTNQCFWWECKQTGSEKQMIFTGEPCTCPDRVELSVEKVLAQNTNCDQMRAPFQKFKGQYSGEPSTGSFVTDVKYCTDYAKRWENFWHLNSNFDCYVASDCEIHCNGGQKTLFQFTKCMEEMGWPITNEWKK